MVSQPHLKPLRYHEDPVESAHRRIRPSRALPRSAFHACYRDQPTDLPRRRVVELRRNSVEFWPLVSLLGLRMGTVPETGRSFPGNTSDICVASTPARHILVFAPRKPHGVLQWFFDCSRYETLCLHARFAYGGGHQVMRRNVSDASWHSWHSWHSWLGCDNGAAK